MPHDSSIRMLDRSEIDGCEVNKVSRKYLRLLESRPLLGGASQYPSQYSLSTNKGVNELPLGTKLVGRYYLLSVLGTGGMSIVYKAKDIRLDKMVAIKTLRYQWAYDELVVKRFQREASALSLLQHPAIVRIRDYGEMNNRQQFFVMDYLIGFTLANLLEQQSTLPLKVIKNIFSQIFDAVGHAHQAGLIHRDLKSSNIMLARKKDREYSVKIVDFGIAKLEQEVQKLTKLGEVWGSPIYMSPEQCMGAPLDARSDIYSLGIVLYEALSGLTPFFGKNHFETMSKQVNQPAPPIRSARPDLLFSQELEDVLNRALEKDPDKRFQSLKQFGQALDKAISGMLATSKHLDVIVRKPHTKSKMNDLEIWKERLHKQFLSLLKFIGWTKN